MRFVAWRGLSDAYRRAVDGHSPWTREEVDPQPITMSDAASDPGLDDELRAVILGEGIRALAFVPLLHQGELLGKFMVYFNEPHVYQDEEIRLAQTVASHVAFAIARHQREETLRAANEAKSRFLATMSHELRTPLNAILGYADLLDMGMAGDLNPDQTEQLERIRSGAMHLLSVIEEILTFSRVEAGKETLRLEAANLAEIAEEAASMVRPAAAQKGLEFHVDVPEPAPDIETDRGKLRQVLLNLLGNAVKFTDRGRVSLRAVVEDGVVALHVRDTGVGIDPTHLRRIFEPFWQVDGGSTRRAGGAGLGLAVTFHLVHLPGATSGSTASRVAAARSRYGSPWGPVWGSSHTAGLPAPFPTTNPRDLVCGPRRYAYP